MNPFIERKGELVELHRKKEKIASDIKKIKDELERKLEALNYVHQNMLLDTELKIKNFPKICDHTDENGDLTTGKEHKIIIPLLNSDITLVKQMCSLCGGTISEKEIGIEIGEKAATEFKTWYQIDDDVETFVDTMTFDPNFLGNFMDYTSYIFNSTQHTNGNNNQ